ncbi:MAG: hypothetical protein M1812_004357 [Candelaria pacifica]|nr:MAG: hypothetical protein M1812_004357 [Candelaria pacifica]
MHAQASLKEGQGMPRGIQNSGTEEEEDEQVDTGRDTAKQATSCSVQKRENGNTRDSPMGNEAVRGQLLWAGKGHDSGYNTRNQITPELDWRRELKISAVAEESSGLPQVIEAQPATYQNLSVLVKHVSKTIDTSAKDHLRSSSIAYSSGSTPKIGADSFELRRRMDKFWKTVSTMPGATRSHEDMYDQREASTCELDSIKAKYNERAQPIFEPVSDYHNDATDVHKLSVSENAKIYEPEMKRRVLEVYCNSALNYHLRDKARGQYVFLLRRLGLTDKGLSAILKGYGIRPGLALGHGLWDPFSIRHAGRLAGIDPLDISQWVKLDSERTIRHETHDEGDHFNDQFVSASADGMAMFTIEEWHQQLADRSSKSSSSSSSSSTDEIIEELAATIESIEDGTTTWWDAPAVFSAILDVEESIDEIMAMLLEFGFESEQWLGLYARDGHRKNHITRQVDIIKMLESQKSNRATFCAFGREILSEEVDIDDLTEEDCFHMNLLSAIDDIRSGKVDLVQAFKLLKGMFGSIEMSDTSMFAHLAEYDIFPKQWERSNITSIRHDSSTTTSTLSTSCLKDEFTESLDLGDSLRFTAEMIGSGFLNTGKGLIAFKDLLGSPLMTDAEMHERLAVHGIQSRHLLDPNQENLSRGLRAMYNAFCGGHIKHTEARQWCRTLFNEPEFELADLPDELNRRGLSTKIVPPQLYEDLEIDMNNIQDLIEKQNLSRLDAFEQFNEAFEQRLLNPAELVPYLRSIEIPADWITSQLPTGPNENDRSAMSRLESASKVTGEDNYADPPSRPSPSPDQATADFSPMENVKRLNRSMLVKSVEENRSTRDPAAVGKVPEPATPRMAELSSKRSVSAKLRRHAADQNSWFATAHEDIYKRWKYQGKALIERDTHFKEKNNLDYAYIKYGMQVPYCSAEDKQKRKAIMGRAIGSFHESLWGLISSPTKARELGLKAGVPKNNLTGRFGLEPSGLDEQRIRDGDTPCPPDRTPSKGNSFDQESVRQTGKPQKCYGNLAKLKKWAGTPNCNAKIGSLHQKSCKRDASNPDPNDQTRKQQKREEDLSVLSPITERPDVTKDQSSADWSPRKRYASNSDPNGQSRKQQKRDRSPSTLAIRAQRVRFDEDSVEPRMRSKPETHSRLATSGSKHESFQMKLGETCDTIDDAPLPEAFELLEDPIDENDGAPLPEAFELLEDPIDEFDGAPLPEVFELLEDPVDEIDGAQLSEASGLVENTVENARAPGLVDVSNPAAPNSMLPFRQSLGVNSFESSIDFGTKPKQDSRGLTAYEERSEKLQKTIEYLETTGGDPSMRAQSIVWLKKRLRKLQFGDENMSDKTLQSNADATERLLSALTQTITSTTEEPTHTVVEDREPLSRIGFFTRYSNYTPGDFGRSNGRSGDDRKLVEAEARERGILLSELIVERIQKGRRRKADKCNDNSYFGNQGPAPSAHQYPAALQKLFDSYRDQPKDSPDTIGIEGAMKYLQALGINLDEVSVLVISEALQSPTMGEFTREGYLNGWQRLAAGHPGGAGTIVNQSVLIGKLCSELPYDEELFKRVYNHTFQIARNAGQKAIMLDTAIEYWRLLFTSPSVTWNSATTPWLDYYIEFLETKWKKGVNKDMWTMTLSFYTKTKEDEYLEWWSEDGAWPSVLDEFVRFIQEKRGGEGHAEKMDVE